MGDESEIAICLAHFSLKAVNSSVLSVGSILGSTRKVFSVIDHVLCKATCITEVRHVGVVLARQGLQDLEHFHRMVSCGRKRKCKHSITENYECRCRTITYARLEGTISGWIKSLSMILREEMQSAC